MTSHNNTGECLIAVTADGMLMIHSSPITLSWVPRDVMNDAYNYGGIVTVGTFDSIDDAKHEAEHRYSAPFDEWRGGDAPPSQMSRARSEIHTPEVEGHRVIHHGIRSK
jgi:hypothetical protein